MENWQNNERAMQPIASARTLEQNHTAEATHSIILSGNGHTSAAVSGRTHSTGMRKILLVANTGWYLYNFRLPLARLLRSRGVEVVMVCPDDPYVERLRAEGFRWVHYNLDRRSLNPFKELLGIFRLVLIYNRERPSAVHHFTIKCVLYGSLAAKMAGIRAVVNAVTGLGYVFIDGSLSARLIRTMVKWLYRRVLTARRVRVVFQNPDDLQAFSDENMIVPDRTVLIRSSGVNLQRFCPRPGSPEVPPAPIVLFASRLINEKGVAVLVEAARILKRRCVNVTVQIAGEPDKGNPSYISEATLEEWRREGAVDLLGHVDVIEDLIAMAAMVVLPSYREGIPHILLEAAAMGIPIVATDVPGCREVVDHNVNGLLVPPKDPVALADAIEKLLSNHELCQKMGAAGRLKMQLEFDDQIVAQRTIEVYNTTLAYVP